MLDFWSSNFLTVGSVKKPILPHLINFRTNSSNACGEIAIFVIFKMSAAAILDLLSAYWDYLQWLPGGQYRCAKCGWNRCSGFDNMKLSIFCPFGFSRPQNWGFGGFYPRMGGQCQRNPQKAHPCASPRRLSNHNIISLISLLIPCGTLY